MNEVLDIPLQERLDVLKANEAFNAFEKYLVTLPPAEMPVTHFFTPGLYIRTIFMPAGSELTSKIHRMTHPFVVAKGEFIVYNVDDEGALLHIKAPYMGITKAGTRRALKILEDTTMTAFYATTETDVAKIEAMIIEPHDYPKREAIE
jgi:hypothetical protein